MVSSDRAPKPLVCVTGASGFLATHVVRLLLERGYPVRGTVRDTQDASRVAHLRELAADCPDRLELVSADLLEPHSYDMAMDGCEVLIHMASPVRLTAPDPAREIVDPAVRGTKNVLGAASTAPSLRRVVMTSSIAAIRDDTRPPDHVFTEDDWNEGATLESSPYPLSKTLAERAAWELQADADFELVTINPTVVFGPIYASAHTRGSISFVLEMLRGRILAAPRLQLSLVDVRDVARAHVAAIEREGASGRYILFNRALWMREIAEIIRSHGLGRRIPRLQMPDWMMYVAALFEKRISFSYLRSHLGVERRTDGSKAQRELGMEFLPIEQTVLDTCRSLITLGLV